MVEKKRTVKVYTLTTALEKLRNFCAYQERYQQEVRDKFYELGLHQNEVEQGIAVLIEEGFLNEERFAIAFAGGKFRIKKWGRNKIRMELKNRKISDYCVKKALSFIDGDQYTSTLEKILTDKARSVKEKNPIQKNYKLARYAISRGFEHDVVWDLLKSEDASHLDNS